MARDERPELIDHLDRCRDLLTLMKDPVHRKAVADLTEYLEAKLVAMERQCDPLGALRQIFFPPSTT
jgi:hypothetical protein